MLRLVDIKTVRPAILDVIHVLLLYLLLGLLFTTVSLIISSAEVKIGTFRGLPQIPPHELVLLGLSLVISASALLANKKLDFSLLFLPPFFVLFLDIDHIPSALGLAQPIRPAHSIFFIVIFAILLFALLKKPISFSLLSLSSFAAHLSIDNGMYPLLAPFSFKYYTLANYKLELFLLSFILAVFAGYIHSKAVKKSVIAKTFGTTNSVYGG